jgi:hypothetical protein
LEELRLVLLGLMVSGESSGMRSRSIELVEWLGDVLMPVSIRGAGSDLSMLTLWVGVPVRELVLADFRCPPWGDNLLDEETLLPILLLLSTFAVRDIGACASPLKGVL